MSHRTAFAVSVAFALLFAIGVLATRDRLFAAPGPAAAPSASTASAGLVTESDGSDLAALGVSGAAARVIDIPLADVLRSQSFLSDDGDDRHADDEGDHWRDGDDDHDEGHDDD